MAKALSATMDDLLKQAKTTNRLLAAQLKNQMTQMELVKLLSTTDLTAKEIADVLDTTGNTVAVTLQRLRNKATETASKRALGRTKGE
jgi:DNA-binding CsgD family transcriptional regulator